MGVAMSAKTVSELRDQVRGEVIAPDDADYEDARRVHNGMIDRRPAVVVRVMNAGDVMATVSYAREGGLEVAIRGGGHSGPGFGTCDGGWPDAGRERRRQRGSVLGDSRAWRELRRLHVVRVPTPSRRGRLLGADVLRDRRDRERPALLSGLHQERARGDGSLSRISD